MIEIQYDDRDVLDALQDLSRRMDDMTPVMRDIAGVMAGATERAFENETDPATGLAWHPLMASTVKMRGGDAHPLLKRSGQLAGSIVTAHGADFAQIGSNKDYAGTHQFGAGRGEFGEGRYKTRNGTFPIPWGDIPARPFLGLGEDDQDEILDIVRSYLAPWVV